MRNRIGLIFLIQMISIGAALGQDSLRFNKFLNFSVGASFPTGEYGASKSAAEGSGFAMSGFHYKLEFAAFWNRNCGFGFEGGRFSNAVNQKSFQNDFQQAYFGSTPLPAGYPITPVSSWKVYYFMIGPYVSLPMKNITIDFKALGGIISPEVPAFSFPKTSGTVTTYQPTLDGAGSGFGCILGTNLRLNVTETTQLLFSMEYFQSYAHGGYKATETFFADWRQTQSITALNLTWGVAFKIKK